MVLYRREVNLVGTIRRATGYVGAQSQYRLTVNGQRIQFGPPSEPGRRGVDPIDLTKHLDRRINVLGVQTLFDGAGTPGMIFRLDVEYADGRMERVVSDEAWQCCANRAYRGSQYDARLHPHGWDIPEYSPGKQWTNAMAVAALKGAELTGRAITPVGEKIVPAKELRESGGVEWLRDPADWFEFGAPESFRVVHQSTAQQVDGPKWEIQNAKPEQGYYLTFAMPERVVGWPHFTIDATEGTAVELMILDGDEPDAGVWLESQFDRSVDFVCCEGKNELESYEIKPVRWLQLHIHNAQGRIVIGEAGVRPNRE